MAIGAKHKHRRGRRALKVTLVAFGVLVLLGGGTAYAAYRYDLSSADRILPGVSVAAVDVSGLTREEAVRKVAEHADLVLGEELSIRAGDSSWITTPSALGVSADVDAAVGRAFAVADQMSFFSRVLHRLQEEPVGASIELGFSYDDAGVASFVEQVAVQVAIPAVDARFELVDGEVVTQRSAEGQVLKEQLAATKIRTALRRGADVVEIPLRSVAPEVSTRAIGTSIVVDISDNQLWFYEGLKVVKEYRVATGTPGYPTPAGTFEIIDKKENPTWYNPAPDTWGAGLPRSIGPGPGNPLGTRAMYLNAPGIRIHGTWSSSSIGTAASHGCIRMHIADSEELYPLVPIGTRVLVKP